MINLPELGPDDEITVEVIEHDAPATNRSFARRIALQVLYELDTTDHRPGDVIEARLASQETDKKEARYVRFLVHGVRNHQQALDAALQQFVLEWPLEQAAIIDRNILRIALLELAVEQKAPVSVIIDEAVSLAQIFGAETSTSFVNGVLGKLAQDQSVRQELHLLKLVKEQDE